MLQHPGILLSFSHLRAASVVVKQREELRTAEAARRQKIVLKSWTRCLSKEREQNKSRVTGR
jgi:hypothetical protein